MTVESTRQNIALVQMLRGIAALMVVLLHINVQSNRIGHFSASPEWFSAGVDIFFVISGFIMWVSTEARPQRTASQFLMDRLIRVAPLYWAMTAFTVIVILLAPELVQSAKFDLKHIIFSFLFLPSEHPAAQMLWPVVIPGWTLNYEMFFYVLFGAAIATSKASSGRRFIIIASLIAATIAAGQIGSIPLSELSFYGNTIIFEFLMGISLGVLYVHCRIADGRCVGLILAGFILLGLSDVYDAPRVLRYGIPAVIIVGGGAFAGDLRFGPLEKLGDISYSLYLSHVISLSAVGQCWKMLGASSLAPALFIATAVIISVLTGAAVYYLVEMPLIRYAKLVISTKRRADPRGDKADSRGM